MKRCSRCAEIKPVGQFGRDKQTRDGLYCYCRSCAAVNRKEAEQRNPGASYRANKKWRAQNPEKAREANRARYAADPEAARAKQKCWRDLHREQLADAWKKRRRAVTLAQYGLTQQQYDHMLVDQGGKCAICSSAEPNHWSGQFQVDHDHKTGAVRGLLCAPCNGGLGLIGDTPERLRSALEYLERTAQIAAAGFFRAS